MKKNTGIGIVSFLIIFLFALILIVPQSREIFKSLSASHPFIMGFIKFGLLATVGELIAARLAKKAWLLPDYIGIRALIWGLIGIAITFMMKSYSFAVSGLIENRVLPGHNCPRAAALFLKAFYTSAIMNLSFGPTFMAFHKCTDKWLELKAKKAGRSVSDIVSAVDWSGFVSFTLFKTIPLFWIPAHTITFMLPAEYQVIMAASLSIALGIILNLKK